MMLDNFGPILDKYKNQTTEEYFNGNQFSIDAFKKKYTKYDEETYYQAVKRVCDYVSSVEETKEKREYWSKRWQTEILEDYWHPAGSIMQGADSGRSISLANCTTISLGTNVESEEWDNLESIIKNTAYTVAKCAAYRQGLGVDFSRLRPIGTKVFNSANESTGAIHWMKFIDSLGYYVGQKGRVPAMLFSISVKHPDVEDFIKVKSDYTKIQNANISVQCTEDFYKAVESDKNWEMEFEIPAIQKGQKVFVDVHSIDKDCLRDKDNKYYYIAKRERPREKITKTVKARSLLELIAKNMSSHSEPGIQNIDIASKLSNSDYLYDKTSEYDSRIISTNACQPKWATVLTEKGISTIEDIKIGSVIWSEDGWVKVINKYSNGIKRVFRASTSSSIFYGTEDHKVISNNERLELGKANTIDFLVGPELQKNNLNIQDVVDGLVIGDGGLRRGRRERSNGPVLYIGKDDKCYLSSEIKDFILKSEYIKGTCEAFNIKTSISHEELPIVSCRKIPKRFFEKKDSLAGFLRGLFSANGTVSINGVSLKTTSKILAENVLVGLSSLGIKAWKCSEAAYTRQFKNGIYKCKESYTVNITIDYDIFYKVIGFIHSYKNDKLKILIASQKINKPKCRNTVNNIREKDFLGEEEVFHIEVDGLNHTYWTGGCNVSNCSEQYLSRESLCVLASINCEKFSISFNELDKELDRIGHSVNRFLDNVNECEFKYQTYATPHQKIAIEKLRRTGAGYTNIAGWLFKKNLEYGSNEGNNAIEEFTKIYNFYLYKSSIELGKEKGSFGLFDREKIEKSPFIQRMIDLGLKFTALRNVTCSSIAPTGSLSLMFRDCVFSYGIEPAFGIYFWKRTRISGKYEYYFNVPNIVRQVYKNAGFIIPMDSDTVKDTWDGKIGKPIAEFIEKHKKEVGIKFKNATEISPTDKLDLMSKVMKWIDSSISVTYMLPENTDWKDVYDFILLAHEKGVKSIAAFPDKKMYGIVSFVAFKDLAFKLQGEGVGIHHQNFSDEEIKELNISREAINLKTDSTPKRLKTLDADINIVTVKGERFIIVIGIQNGQPYEMFGGHLNGLKIDTYNKRGKITKLGKRKYCLEFDDIKIEDFSAQFTPTEKILFRMASLLLRSGVPIHFVIEQLGKATDDITTMAAAAARVLKKYIKDGQRVGGQKCPSCGSNELFYQDGCVSCKCSWSRCN